MKNKILFLVLLTTFLFSMMFVSAEMNAITITIPADGSTLSNNMSVEAHLNLNSSRHDNCSWYVTSVSTANTTLNGIGQNVSNLTVANFSYSINFSHFEDASNYVLNVTCNNGTDVISDTSTGLILDTTAPQIPSSLSPSDLTLVTTAGSKTFTSTVRDANTTACTYTLYRGGNPSDGNSGATTYASSTCSFTKAITSSDNGLWFWKIVASDGLNTSASSTLQYNIAIPVTDSGLPLTSSGEIVGQESSNWLIWVLVIAGLVAVLWFIFK